MPRPKSMMIAFYVSTVERVTPWVTLELANAAAEAHRLDLVATGHDWATPGPFPNCGPHNQYQSLAAGLYIGTKITSLSDPAGTERVVYNGEWWFGPPPAIKAKPAARKKGSRKARKASR